MDFLERLRQRLNETEQEAVALTDQHQAGEIDREQYLAGLERLAALRAELKNLLPTPVSVRLIAAGVAAWTAWKSFDKPAAEEQGTE